MMQCEHIHGNGTRCLTPAMHRRNFCYMHWRQREHKLAVPPEPEFQLPTIDSEASVVLATNQISAAVLSGKLDTKRARVALACLKMALDSLRRLEDVSDRSELELTPAMEKELVGTEMNNDLGTGEDKLLDAARPRAASPTADTPTISDGETITIACAAAAATDSYSASTTRNPPQSAPLSAHQLKLMKKILRRGPKHPQFHLAARLVDHAISDAS